jgi:GntR family transcriptional regulator of arabinose operon
MPKATAERAQPLYQRVIQDICAHIESGQWRPGDKLPSEHALCERYGVSQITVRRALRELAQAGRVYSHHGLGWFVSVERAAQAAEVTLLLFDLDEGYAPVVHALAQALYPHGVVLRLALVEGPGEDEAEAVAEAIARGAGALVLDVTGEERRLIQRYHRLLRNVEIPVLFLRHEVNGLDVPAAILDEASCMEQLTRHILALGHQRVAYAGNDPALVEGQRQYWGFATTLWDHGLELPLDWVFTGDLAAEREAARFRRTFQGAERPTALVCASALQAAEAMHLLRELELHCPEDVAIVALGDSAFAPLLPTPLTTFRLALAELGQAAAQLLLELVAGHPVQSVRLTGELVVRQSCGAHAART